MGNLLEPHLAVLGDMHPLRAQAQDPRLRHVLQRHASRAGCSAVVFGGPDLFHLDTLRGLGFSLLDAQLLEEHVRGVEDRAVGAGGRALFDQEGRELARVGRGMVVRGRLRWEGGVDAADEGGVGAALFTDVPVDLGADVIARVEDGDRVGVFAVEVHVQEFDFLVVFGCTFLASARATRALGIRCFVLLSSFLLLGFLLGRQWETRDLALLEEPGRGHECVAFNAFVGPVLLHEAVVAGRSDAELLLELADFELAAVDVLPDFGSDLVRAPFLARRGGKARRDSIEMRE